MNKQVRTETIQTEGLVIQVFGVLPFVRPADRALSQDHEEDLGRACELVGLGAMAAAAAILGHVERQLGVTQEEHILGVLAGEAHMATARRRAQMAVSAARHERVESLTRAVAMPAPNQGVELNLAQADAARARVDEIRAVRDRRGRVRDQAGLKAALTDVRKYHDRAARLRQEQLSLAWASRAEIETLELATARGEDAGWGDDAETQEAVRIKSRDGLETLFESGTLTLNQRRTGRAFRQRHELSLAGLKIASMSPASGYRAPGDPLGRSAAAAKRAELLNELAEMELAVGRGPDGDRRLALLRAVAGDGHCIRDVVKGGGARIRATIALKRALDLAADGLAVANRGH